MEKDKVVTDTNCIIAMLSKRGKYYSIWKGLQEGKFLLCVSNEILNKYQEIIERKTTSFIAENVVQLLLNCQYVVWVEPTFEYNLITADPDDNKFAYCAIAANALCLVSNDKHFNILKKEAFPHVDVVNIRESLARLYKIDNI